MTRPDLQLRVAAAIGDWKPLRRGESLLVAVSGGLDSMVLLHLLARLAPENNWRLHVAHFNHCLRGRSSDADERWVKQAAADLGLRCLIGRGQVRLYAARHGLSVEMAARKLRHDFLAQTARRLGVKTIVLAHHADDQLELFFLRLLRGAGGEGLAGMKPLSPSPSDPSLTLARPLLDQTKAALKDYARRERIRPREDASNASVEFLRNRIRHRLLPELEAGFGTAAWKTIPRLMEIVGAEAEYVTEAARAWLARRMRPGRQRFAKLAVAVQRRVIQLQLLNRRVTPEFDLIERLRLEADCAVCVATGLEVWRTVGGLVQVRRAVPRQVAVQRFDSASRTLDLKGRGGEAEFAGVTFRWRGQRNTGLLLPKAIAGREYFDAGKVGDRMVLRHWRPGDRFQPIGMEVSVKLQDLFTNLKVPRAERGRRIVAATAAGEVFWVEGMRIGERFKLDNRTARRLKWCWTRRAAPRLRPPGVNARLPAKSERNGRRE